MFEDHLAKLMGDVKAWNAWREEERIDGYTTLIDLGGANLSGANLRKADLVGANLSGADLSGADLRKADLVGANLSGANLNRANLIGANLSEANLKGAFLSMTFLREADLSEADLSKANLEKALISKTVFGNTNLKGATDLATCDHHGPSTIDHRTLQISGQLPIKFLQGCGLPDLLIDYLPTLINQPIQFYSCFISYSHEDKIFARRLHDQLQGKGIRCWLDEHQILPGDDIHEQVDRGIKLWDKVLLCCSEPSLTSWWVDKEINTAFQKEQKLMRERKEKVLSLIPLNLDGHLFRWENGKADEVKSRMAADFTGWEKDNEKFEAAFDELVKALKTDNRSREPAPKTML